MATTTQTSTLISVFSDNTQANEAMVELKQAGFTEEQIGFATRETEVVVNAGEDAVKGAVAGGIVGGIVGAAGAFLIPGMGTVIAGGLLANVLGAALAGASTAGLAGGFIGAIHVIGISDEEASFYSDELQSGRTIVTVQSADRTDEVREILRRHGGYDIHSKRTVEEVTN
jgi:hypothetical protein